MALPSAIEGKKDLFLADRFYFGGQPDEETFRWLKGEGIKLVVNLRTPAEMEAFVKEAFDEPALLRDLGMSYLHIPIGGETGYSPASVDSLAEALEKESGKVLIHCKVGGRVSYLWVAYLIRNRGYGIDEAIEYGKKMKYTNYLEDLLGYSTTCRKKE